VIILENELIVRSNVFNFLFGIIAFLGFRGKLGGGVALGGFANFF